MASANGRCPTGDSRKAATDCRIAFRQVRDETHYVYRAYLFAGWLFIPDFFDDSDFNRDFTFVIVADWYWHGHFPITQ